MKFASKILVMVMMINLFSAAVYAQKKQAIITPVEGTPYTWEIEKDTSEYQKIKITNTESGDVEYVESKLVEDSYVHIATTKNNRYEVKKEGEEIQIKDKDNIITRISKLEIEHLKIIVDGSITEESNRSGNLDISSTQSILSNTNWVFAPNLSGYGSVSSLYNVVSVLASVLATIYGGKPTGVVVAIATGVIAEKLPSVYYYVRTESRIFNGWIQIRKTVTYYKYHDYTARLGTVAGPIIDYYCVR